MNIFLCGQKLFGKETLDLLLSRGHNVVGVCAPREDRGGRADRLYSRAAFHGLPLLNSGELNASTLPDGVDLIVCAHSHDFVGRATRQKSKHGAIGYHPSLLPLHRGRDAVKWTIRDGDKITGGSVYWLTDVVDGGPIAAQDWCFVRPDDTPESLWRRELFPMGLRLFNKTLRDIESRVLVQIPQDTELASWEPSFNPPPLMRPDLPQLTDGRGDGFKRIVSREQVGNDDLGTAAAMFRLALYEKEA